MAKLLMCAWMSFAALVGAQDDLQMVQSKVVPSARQQLVDAVVEAAVDTVRAGQDPVHAARIAAHAATNGVKQLGELDGDSTGLLVRQESAADEIVEKVLHSSFVAKHQTPRFEQVGRGTCYNSNGLKNPYSEKMGVSFEDCQNECARNRACLGFGSWKGHSLCWQYLHQAYAPLGYNNHYNEENELGGFESSSDDSDAYYCFRKVFTHTYVAMTDGAYGCPEGSEITTEWECKHAIGSLPGNDYSKVWSGETAEGPRWCSMTTSGEVTMNFNRGEMGAGHDGVTPVCHKQVHPH